MSRSLLSTVNIHVLVDGKLVYSFAVRGPWCNGSVTNRVVQYLPGNSTNASSASRALSFRWSCIVCGSHVGDIKKYIRLNRRLLRNNYCRMQHKFTFTEVCTSCMCTYGLKVPCVEAPITARPAKDGSEHVVKTEGTMDCSEVVPDSDTSSDSD
uniref:Cysteine rich protein n=1 Tax=Rice stripe necrosis virus TaxID=373373 RepID=A0A513PVZ9_9VIRU|nr:Cysteine rich protein [Rice stripe necrosis virus]QAR21024.1 Cysteine rich protein [Rice stripe necrosis virus]QUQ73243.1 cysteine rich protein [Rice stripe necrosis virus]QUQ73249.1 cysteine rich protein [Rice stripe necrosis virus]QUQ73255.1 cysteine rich protein [Rice stripe necrosis virus]